MPSPWIEALKEWNAKHNAGTWCVPRKGSKDLEEARAILARIKAGKGKKVEAPAAPAMESKKGTMKVKKASPEAMETFAKAKKAKEGKKEMVKSFLTTMIEKRRAKKAEAKPAIVMGEKVKVKKAVKKEAGDPLDVVPTYKLIKTAVPRGRGVAASSEGINYANRVANDVVRHVFKVGKEGTMISIPKAIASLEERMAQKSIGLLKDDLLRVQKYLSEIQTTYAKDGMVSVEDMKKLLDRYFQVKIGANLTQSLELAAPRPKKKAVKVEGLEIEGSEEEMAELKKMMAGK